jgi:hypothetical protein
VLPPRGGLIVFFHERYRHKNADYTDIVQIL